jgi:hypothetical protein
MGTVLSYLQTGNQFKVNYPHYGLFGTADVKLLRSENESLFECKLMNGAVLWLKKMGNSKRWIDAQLNRETSLASVIGMYIDDIIKES